MIDLVLHIAKLVLEVVLKGNFNILVPFDSKALKKQSIVGTNETCQSNQSVFINCIRLMYPCTQSTVVFKRECYLMKRCVVLESTSFLT